MSRRGERQNERANLWWWRGMKKELEICSSSIVRMLLMMEVREGRKKREFVVP